ncbi:Retrotransposon-derived protein PEG10 [Smittium culicis]|uniref:Retrotransposon-derived protein PEG10 n=1 Tax=Smittium culicis TaxID=133412 RepID=A0A1R1X7B5_9FUNG|nr:Retrotransposon-derived protein PEG10 [Smittium culicis]
MLDPNSIKNTEETVAYKLSEIEKFSGSPEKYPAFMAAIRRRFWANTNQFSTDHKKIDFISGHLTGSAMVWFDAIITEADPATTNFEELSAVFKSHFSDSGYALKSTYQLMTFYQGKRSIAEYASEFRSLAIISEFNEKVLIMQFQRGLNCRILGVLINSPLPNSISELIDVSVDIDNRIASRDTFRQKYVPRYENNAYRQYQPYKGNHYTRHNEPSNNLSHQAINNHDGSPMEIDTLKVRPRGPLSRKEKIRRFINGLCLYCASDKHIVRDCGLFPQSLKAKPQQ